MSRRRHHPLKNLQNTGPLSAEEQEDFQSRLNQARIGVALSLLFGPALVAFESVFKVEVPPPAVVAAIFAIVIYLIYRLSTLKCPRCGTAPTASNTSFTTGEVQASRFVTLNPKICQKCGVQLKLEKPAEKSISS